MDLISRVSLRFGIQYEGTEPTSIVYYKHICFDLNHIRSHRGLRITTVGFYESFVQPECSRGVSSDPWIRVKAGASSSSSLPEGGQTGRAGLYEGTSLEIESHSIEQVFVSYIDTTIPTSHRRRILKETYNFECNCTLCNQLATSDPRESVWCPKSCGGTCPTPSEGIKPWNIMLDDQPDLSPDSDAPQCSTCRAAIQSSGEIVDAVRVGQEALDKASFLRREGTV